MKEVIKDKTIVEHYTVYESFDGEEFSTKQECRKYEESALAVMRGKVARLIVHDTSKVSGEDAWTIMGGCDDHDIVAFKLDIIEDADTFLQFLFLECPWYLNESHAERKKEVEDIIIKACKDKDLIIMGKNCDGDYYFINSRQNIIDKLMGLDKKEDKKDV